MVRQTPVNIKPRNGNCASVALTNKVAVIIGATIVGQVGVAAPVESCTIFTFNDVEVTRLKCPFSKGLITQNRHQFLKIGT